MAEIEHSKDDLKVCARLLEGFHWLGVEERSEDITDEVVVSWDVLNGNVTDLAAMYVQTGKNVAVVTMLDSWHQSTWTPGQSTWTPGSALFELARMTTVGESLQASVLPSPISSSTLSVPSEHFRAIKSVWSLEQRLNHLARHPSAWRS